MAEVIQNNNDIKQTSTDSGYFIRTIEDLYEIIKTNEKWREALRRELLSPALLRMPEEFASFRENEFKPLAKKVDIIEQDVAVLKQDVAVLKQDVASLKIDVSDLQGSDLERRVREKAAAYLGRIIRRCRTITHDKLAELLDDAVDAGKITEDMRADAILIDVVVTGRLSHDRQREVVLAVEVSKVVDKDDILRARRRAEIIAQAFGIEGIGVAFGKSCTQGAQLSADEQHVLIICQSSEAA